MKRCNLSIFALGAVLMLTTMTTAYAEDAARVPNTAAARLATDVITRAERAVAAFVAACAARDAPEWIVSRPTMRASSTRWTIPEPSSAWTPVH